MVNFKKTSAAVAVAMALGVSGNASAAISDPGALSDAYLALSGFTIGIGTGDATKGGLLPIAFETITQTVDGVDVEVIDPNAPFVPGAVNLRSVLANYQVSANVGGASGTDVSDAASAFVPGVPVSLIAENGIVGFVPGTTLNAPIDVTDFANTFAAAASTSQGNALLGGDNVQVHSQLVVNQSSSEAHSNARQTLTSEFTIVVDDEFLFELNFDAEGFLRLALGQNGVPNNVLTQYTWSASVTRKGASPLEGAVFLWEPEGAGDAIDLGAAGTEDGLSGSCTSSNTCRVYSDAFDMNNGASSNGEIDFELASAGTFDAELLLGVAAEDELQGFSEYTFTIIHTTQADGQTPLPEPGTLALLGAGLVGMAARRRKAA